MQKFIFREKEDNLKNLTHEQLEVCISNKDMINDILRDRLYLLSGCRNFGGQDGMDGGCVECSFKNKDLHQRCCLFQISARMYLQEKYKNAYDEAKTVSTQREKK